MSLLLVPKNIVGFVSFSGFQFNGTLAMGEAREPNPRIRVTRRPSAPAIRRFLLEHQKRGDRDSMMLPATVRNTHDSGSAADSLVQSAYERKPQ